MHLNLVTHKTLAQELAEQARDQAPTVTRCALCDMRIIHEGTFAEGRVAALQHRQASHPEIRERAKKKRHLTVQEQSARANAVSRSKLTPETYARMQAMYRKGASIAGVAREFWEPLGYKNMGACASAVGRAFEKDGTSEVAA